MSTFEQIGALTKKNVRVMMLNKGNYVSQTLFTVLYGALCGGILLLPS